MAVELISNELNLFKSLHLTEGDSHTYLKPIIL